MRTNNWPVIGTFFALGAMVAAPAWAQRSDAFAGDRLAESLKQNDVIIGRSQQGTVDEGRLRALIQRDAPNRPLKIVVADGLPASGAQFGSRGQYVKALHDYLGLGRGTLFVLVWSGAKSGAYAATDPVPSTQIESVIRESVPALRQDRTGGIEQIVGALDAAASGEGNAPASATNREARMGEAPQRDGSGTGWLLPVGLGVAGVGGAAYFGRKAWQKRKLMDEARAPVDRLHAEVVEGISYADTYLDLLPESPDARAAKEARARAVELLNTAGQAGNAAREPQDYGRAQALLEQALEEVGKVRHHVDVATGGTGMALGIEGTEYRATPVAQDGSPNSQAAPIQGGLRVEDIPENERAACFFCSRPARVTDLTPITIALNGQRRKVLACADDVEIVRHGSAPEVRAVEENGERLPWYRAQQYDPYRDYNRGRTYTRSTGYGVRNDSADFIGYSGYSGGMLDGLLLGAMMSQPMMMPYPVFMTPGGYATNNPMMEEPQVYGGDAGGFSGGDNDSGFGGVDFNASGDTGGWGGSGFDSGGFDGGGFDAGGGGDFGGGSDF